MSSRNQPLSLFRQFLVLSLVLGLIPGCGAGPEATSSVKGDDDHSAEFSVGVDSSGNFSSGRRTDLIAFSEGFQLRDPSATRGERKNHETSHFDSVASAVKEFFSTSGDAQVEKGRPLNKEAADRVHFDPNGLPSAGSSGETQSHRESYETLTEARTAFSGQQASATSSMEHQRGNAAAVAAAMREIAARSARDHNSQVQVVEVSAADLADALASLPPDRFKTPSSSRKGRELREAGAYLEAADRQVEALGGPTKATRQQLLSIARSALEAADGYYAAGDDTSGDIARAVALAALDMSLSMTPGIGLAKDLIEAATGRSILTGEKLDGFARSAAVLGVLTAGVGGTLLKAGRSAAVIAKLGIKDVQVAEKAVAFAEAVAKDGDEFGEMVAKSAETMKRAEKLGMTEASGAKMMSAAEANAPYIALQKSPPYTPGTVVVEGEIQGQFTRVVKSSQSTPSPWCTQAEDSAGMSANEIESSMALPSTPGFKVTVDLPPGTRGRIGIAAENFGKPGGGFQIEILGDLDPSWYRDPVPLP
jgi:hypothetical protein